MYNESLKLKSEAANRPVLECMDSLRAKMSQASDFVQISLESSGTGSASPSAHGSSGFDEDDVDYDEEDDDEDDDDDMDNSNQGASQLIGEMSNDAEYGNEFDDVADVKNNSSSVQSKEKKIKLSARN